MKKRFLSAGLAVVMAASLTACGGSGSASTTAAAAGEAKAEGESKAAESSAADGASFKIGGIGPVTGGAAVYGLAVQHGAEIAVKEINEAGGINGYPVEFQFQDDEHDAEKSVNAYNTLKDWGMQALMGTVTSAPCIAVADKTAADNMFQILPIYYTEASLILQQANTMGFAPQFFGCDGMDGILQVQNFDVKLAEGLMLLTPFAADATDDLTVKFVKSFEDAYGEIPIQFAADAYDAMYIIKAAMEEANVTPDMAVGDICDAMEGAMTKIKVDGLTGTNMTWTEDGEPEKDPKAVQVVDGAYKAME